MNATKVFLLILLISFLVGFRAMATEGGGVKAYILPECESIANGKIIYRRTQADYFGARLPPKVCTSDYGNGIPFYSRIRINKNSYGGFDMELSCEKDGLHEFLKKNYGKYAYFVINGKVVGSATIADNLDRDRCYVRNFASLGDVTRVCEIFGRALGQQVGYCYSLCKKGENFWACVQVFAPKAVRRNP